MMLAIRHTFPDGQQLNGSTRPGCEGLVTAGNSTPPKVAHWLDQDEAEQEAENFRGHYPGHTFEVVKHPDAP